MRGFVRSIPRPELDDPPIEWFVGDLGRVEDRRRAVAGVGGVVHAGGWVSLGADPRGESRVLNVEATRGLLEAAPAAGADRFLYTSTLWTVAAGTEDAPADEETAWNLDPIRSPYSETKRKPSGWSGCEPARLPHGRRLSRPGDRPARRPADLDAGLARMRRDRPSLSCRAGASRSSMRGSRALGHVRALERAEPGGRYVLAGPYLGYQEMAALVARITGRPRRVVTVPDVCERPFAWLAGRIDRWSRGRWPEVSAAAVAGGFLRLRVQGRRRPRLRPPPPAPGLVDLRRPRRRPPVRPGPLAPPSPADRLMDRGEYRLTAENAENAEKSEGERQKERE